MPTASASQILGNNECFEPYTSNPYVRRVHSGEFTMVNRHLLHDLTRLGLWCPAVKNQLVAANGSVKAIYKTVWEIKQRQLVYMAADRGAFIDQSQSFNVHMPDVTYGKLTSLHFTAWRLGLQKGMYYLRTNPAAEAIKFTVDQEALLREEAAKSSDSSGDTTERTNYGSRLDACPCIPLPQPREGVSVTVTKTGDGCVAATWSIPSDSTFAKCSDKHIAAMSASSNNSQWCPSCEG
eukprot:jgi/Ulvmu1/3511/UM162_0018.1